MKIRFIKNPFPLGSKFHTIGENLVGLSVEALPAISGGVVTRHEVFFAACVLALWQARKKKDSTALHELAVDESSFVVTLECFEEVVD